MAITTAKRKTSSEVWGALGVAAASVAAWWAWMGWDTTYQIDPATGNETGPYEAWQVIGCVLTLMVVAVLGGLAMRPWLAPIAMTVAFTAAWSWQAGTTDETGLWLVGAILIFFGLAWGSSLFSFGAWLCRRLVRDRRMRAA